MLNRTVADDGRVAAYGDEFGTMGLVFHHRLIAFLDVNGNVEADPYWLKGTVMRRVAGCFPEDCRKLSRGLLEHGLAAAYEVDGNVYLHFPAFRANQVGLRLDREKPEVPTPQGFDESSGKLPDDCRIPAGSFPARFPPEVEVEVEVESTEMLRISGADAPKNASRGSVDPGAESERATTRELAARFMPLVRERLHAGPLPRDWTEAREVTVLRQMVAKGYDPDEIEDAIVGLAFLRDRGALEWAPKGTTLTLRALYDPKGERSRGTDELFRRSVHYARKNGLARAAL